MFGLGYMEILVLASMSGSMSNADLVVFIQPQHYFQSRQIEVSIDKMVNLASSDPKDAKSQIRQLTALRYLMDEAESLKKSPNYAAQRDTLLQIALGKKSQDKVGFAKDYASALLAKLDGAKRMPVKLLPLREDAFAWFPAAATLVVAFDHRQAQGSGNADKAINELLKLMPDKVKQELYDQVEKTGNVRIDRIAFAFVQNEKNHDLDKFMVRITGKANPAWLLQALESASKKEFQTKRMKDAQDTPIVILHESPRSPTMMFIGNTEMVMAGYKNNQEHGKQDELVKDLLDVRAKKQPNATAGALKTQLAKIPDKAVALVVGEVNDDMKKAFMAINPAPVKFSAYILHTNQPQGLDVNVEATMKNADDATALVKQIGMLRTQGIEAVKKAQQQPLPPGLPPSLMPSLINVLESLQVQSDGASTKVRAVVPSAMLQNLPALFIGVRSDVLAPPIPPAPVKAPNKN